MSEFLQSQLNQHYDNEEVNENAFELFEYEVASDLVNLTENQRSILESLASKDFKEIVWFIQRIQILAKDFHYNDMEYNYDEVVPETISNALVTCRDWEHIKNSIPKGGYCGK
jgi:pterin-4a-carbinolamine dehydratase